MPKQKSATKPEDLGSYVWRGGQKIELTVDQTYPMKIIKLSPSERKIGLSIKALKEDRDREDWQSYTDGSGGQATLGDHFRNQ